MQIERSFSVPFLFIVLAICLFASLSYAQTEIVLHNFLGGPKDGASPSGLVLDSAGNLYGTTSDGGTFAGGIAFEISPSGGGSWTETILHNFAGGADGFEPTAGLVLDAAGNLYGTTMQGGTGPCVMGRHSGCGTVFELSPSGNGSWTEKVLYSFAGRTDGEWPRSNMIFDAAGNLYGTTSYGGTHSRCETSSGFAIGCGTVFELTPHANGVWAEKIIHNFGVDIDGQIPYSGLIFDKDGNLYGTTSWGGPFVGCGGDGKNQSCGVVFELSPVAGKGWDEKLLSPTGYGLFTNVAIDSEGNLYGSAISGGGGAGDCMDDYAVDCGEVWELSPTGSGSYTSTTLINNGSGSEPSAVTFDASGNFYGTQYATEDSVGDPVPALIYEMSLNASGGWIYTVFYSFSNAAQDGFNPSGGLILDASGNLYGTTLAGGTYNKDVVYEITP